MSRIGVVLRERLGVGELSGTDTARVRASVPSSPEVVRLYTEGLARLRLAEYLAARDLLVQVIAAQPDSRSVICAGGGLVGARLRGESERSRQARVRALRGAVSRRTSLDRRAISRIDPRTGARDRDLPDALRVLSRQRRLRSSSRVGADHCRPRERRISHA